MRYYKIMKDKEVKKIVDWMYSKDNPNKEKRWNKKIVLKSFLKQNNEFKRSERNNRRIIRTV